MVKEKKMNRLIFVAGNNIRKQKGDMITFFILTFISAFLIFNCLSALTGLGRVMDDRFSEIHGAHVMIYSTDTEEERDAARRAFTENPEINEFEATPAIRFITDYKNKKDSEYLQYMFIAESFYQEKTIMKIDVPEAGRGKEDIYLPYNLKGRFAAGDIIQLKFGDDVYEFTVRGYLEDPYFCTTMNITVYCIAMAPEMIEELSEKYPSEVSCRILNKGRAAEDYKEKGLNTQDLEQEISDSYKHILEEYAKEGKQVNSTDYLGVNWEMMRGGSQFLPQILMAVMLVFAVLIMILAMVIISFSVTNFIRKNMKNTGILEACGYTVRELRGALVLQIVLVALTGTIAGIVTAALSFKRFGSIISQILGLSWTRPFNTTAAVIVLVVMPLLIGLAAIKVSAAYKKISVLDALRGGITTHNFKRNPFELENTPLPLPLTLALKDTFREPGKNLIMVLISMLLVTSVVIGFGMNETFGKDPDKLVKLLAFEMGTAEVSCGGQSVDASEDLRALDGVTNVLTQFSFEPFVINGDKKEMFQTYAVDDMENTRYTSIIEGRMPQSDNEIMVTSGVAKDMGIAVGDVVTLELSDRTTDVIVTGINQRLERMGRTIYMRLDCAKKLYTGDIRQFTSYIVTVRDGMEYARFKEELDRLGEEKGIDFSSIDLALNMEGTMGSVTMGMKILCMVISVITVLIVVFVESLVIRAKISHEWRGMGISKALGQTSGGLIKQIMLSNIPAITAGALLGAVLAVPAGNAAIRAAFSLFVIKNVSLTISPMWMLASVTGIIVVALLTSSLAGLRVRGLKPAEMICEE